MRRTFLTLALACLLLGGQGMIVKRNVGLPSGGGGGSTPPAANGASANIIDTDGDTTATLAYTGPAGSNRLLVVSISTRANTGTPTISSVTYNSVALTQWSCNDYYGADGTKFVCLYYLVAPATGANNVVVTMSGATTGVIVGAQGYSGVNQSTPVGTAVTAGGSDITPTNTVSSATSELVVDAIAYVSDQVATATAGQTSSIAVHSGVNFALAHSYKTGAASTTLSWTLTEFSDTWGSVAGALKPA